jgi:hypothetical protein
MDVASKCEVPVPARIVDELLDHPVNARVRCRLVLTWILMRHPRGAYVKMMFGQGVLYLEALVMSSSRNELTLEEVAN